MRTETTDGWFYITRTFDFRKDSKAIEIATEITNRKGFGIADVTFKELADWDLDGSASGDTFDYD